MALAPPSLWKWGSRSYRGPLVEPAELDSIQSPPSVYTREDQILFKVYIMALYWISPFYTVVYSTLFKDISILSHSTCRSATLRPPTDQVYLEDVTFTSMVHDITLHMFTTNAAVREHSPGPNSPARISGYYNPRPENIEREQQGKREYVRSGTKYKQRKDGRGVHERDWRDRRPGPKGGIIRHAPEPASGERTARNEK